MNRCVLIALAGAFLLVSGIASAQAFDAAPPLRRDYTGPSVVAHENQVFNIFYPTSPAPPEGYPVVVMLQAGGFLSAQLTNQILPITGVLHDFLMNDIAFVIGTGTPSRGGDTGNPVDGVVGDGLGPAYKGNGVFVPPGYDVGPTYTGGPLHPINDPDRPMSEKDVVMLVQHVKENAGSLNINPDRIALHGRSSSSIVSWFVAAGPDRSDIWLNPSGQELQDTRVSAAILRSGMTYWPVLSPTSPPKAYHFPRRMPPGGGLLDIPANDLRQAPPELLEEASALVYALDEDSHPGLTLEVHQRPFHITYGGDTLDMPDISGPPYVQDHYTNSHTAWVGFAMKNKFCNMRFVVSDLSAAVGMPPIYDAIFDTDPDAVDADMIAWILDLWSNGTGDAWAYADVGLAGTDGIAPVLRACGPFTGGSDNEFELRSALPSASSTLVVGFSELNAPFKGGVLAPSPDVLVSLPVGINGVWSLPFVLPAGLPSGVSIFFQAWVIDPGAATGFDLAASNAASVITP